MAESTWHRWVAQYGGLKANDAKRLEPVLGGVRLATTKLAWLQWLHRDCIAKVIT